MDPAKQGFKRTSRVSVIRISLCYGAAGIGWEEWQTALQWSLQAMALRKKVILRRTFLQFQHAKYQLLLHYFQAAVVLVGFSHPPMAILSPAQPLSCQHITRASLLYSCPFLVIYFYFFLLSFLVFFRCLQPCLFLFYL